MDDLRLWETPNLLVDEAYKADNYEVKDYGNTNLCYIFFSSHGLFFPDTTQEFQEKIVCENRFEWKNIASSKEIIDSSGRHIFVRDIYKQWYIKGINCRINTIDKMIAMLRQLTQGYDIVTVGSSAGGYIAALVAAKLSAKCCFCFSGQVTLWESAKTNPFVGKGINEDSINKYYEISKIIGDSTCNYYYFYPQNNVRDVEQFALIQRYPNVKGFAFCEKNHAASMIAGNMRYIICRDKNYMDALYMKYRGKIINKYMFLLETVPFHMIPYIMSREVKHFLNRRLGKNI